jgi:hypothetical protein
MDNLDTFIEVYTRHLTEVVTTNPSEYAYGVDKVPAVVVKMKAAILAKSVNKDGKGFQKTCKELKIPYTYKAIYQFCGVS